MKKNIFATFLALLVFIFLVRSSYSQWIQTNGPEGGRATCLAVSGSNIFAGFDGGGIYLSTDNGSSWLEAGTGMGCRSVTAIYASGTELFAAACGSIYYSSNNGTSWVSKSTGLETGIVNTIVEKNGNLFAATNEGIYLSSNWGNNWTASDSGLTSLSVNTLILKDSDFYAGTWGGGIFKSTNNGNSWFQVNTGLTSADISALGVLGNKIIAASFESAFYISDNDGQSWGLSNGPEITQIRVFSTYGSIIAAGGFGDKGKVIYLSSDGNNWTNISSGMTAKEIRSIVFKDSKIFAGCYYSGIYSKSDLYNGEWEQINNGIIAAPVSKLTTEGEDIFCGTYGSGIFLSTDEGNTWNGKNKGLSSLYIEDFKIIDSNIYAATQDGINRSTDNGEIWQTILPQIWVTSIAAGKDKIIAGAYGKIYISKDMGNSWTVFTNGLPLNSFINDIAVQSDKIYAGTDKGIFLSSDEGQNWIDVSSNLKNNNIRTIAVTDSAILVGTFSTGVWKSANEGKEWTHLSQLYNLQYVNDIIIKGNSIFAASDVYVYSSADNGKTWSLIAPDFPLSNVNALTYNNSNLFAGLDGSGVWKRSFSEQPYYNVSVATRPNGSGIINGAGIYSRGSIVTLTAAPKENYKFVNWTKNDTVVSADNPYQFTILDDKSLTANFTLLPKLSVSPNYINVPEDSGSASFIVDNQTGDMMNWTAVSKSPWIKIASGDSGINEDTIKIKYEGNRSIARTGSITVAAPGAAGSPVTVEIRQAKMLDTLTILHVNDTHSMLAPCGPRNSDLEGTCGGIARAATVIETTKKTDSKVLTLHGGDVFIGDLFFNQYFGIAEFKLMNELGFDAMVLGNHEFDLGPVVLQMAFDSSLANGGFEVLSSNTILEADGLLGLRKYVKPYTVKNFGNVKVGIFGLTTPSTNLLSQPSPAVIDTNIEACIANSLKELTAEKCNVIICLSHLGMNYDEQIAAEVPGINLIVSAHDHLKTEKPIEIKNPSGGETYIVEAGAFYHNIGKLKFVIDTGKVSLLSYELISLDQNIPEEPDVAANVNELIKGIEATYGKMYTQQVGYAEDTFEEAADPLNADGLHSTPAGNLITDAFRAKTGTDIAITVGGAIAQPLYKGPIVAADVFRMIGYGFNEVNGLGYRLVKFNITGPDLWAALQICLSQTVSDDEFFPQVSGMKYGYTNTGSGLQLSDAFVNNVPIGPASSAVYSVTTNEYIAYALRNLFGIPVSNFYIYNDSTEFQVVLDYIISKGGIISPDNGSRITSAGSSNNQAGLLREFKLEQNYPNPFNPITVIKYQLKESGKTTLKIYNLLGQEVVTLVNEVQTAGEHNVEWNAGGFASGVYFYQLKAGNFVVTKKLILLR